MWRGGGRGSGRRRRFGCGGRGGRGAWVRGGGVIVGWKRIDVATATGYLDTDYAAKGRAGVKALEEADVVAVHIEATDEASHEGRADAKVAALEEIDRHIVGPLLEAVQRYPGHRILVSPDHRRPLGRRE